MRHGQSTVNVEHRLTCRDPKGDLTMLGREQAARAADWLADRGIQHLYSSPFDRAQQTAQVIAARLNLDMVTMDGLREMDCGRLDGRTDAEAWAEWTVIFNRWHAHDWDAGYPGGETYRQAYDRFTACLAPARSDETTLLVTHGGVTGCVVPFVCVNAAALQGPLLLDNTGFVVLEPYDSGRYICRAWNLVEHLA